MAGGGSSAISLEARLPAGKTLDNFDFAAVPMLSKARVMALAAGDAWLDKASNLLLFGPPGAGKSHCAVRRSAAPSSKTAIVSCLPVPPTSSRSCNWPAKDCNSRPPSPNSTSMISWCSTICHTFIRTTQKPRVLFELIGARYERRSMLITANQPFADWNKVFPDQAMMIAAIDRLVHHSIIFEMNVESYRRRGALDRKTRATAPSKPANRGRRAVIVAARVNQTRSSQQRKLLASVNQQRQSSSTKRSRSIPS